MRRKDREITDMAKMLEIIGQCPVCRLGMSLDNAPYVVPLNFGFTFDDGVITLYFHGAFEGHKVDILKQNPAVCVEMDTGHCLIPAATAAKYGFAYQSVIGFGTVEFVQANDEKIQGLLALMRHQTGQDGNEGGRWQFADSDLERVCVYKVRLTSVTGKARPLPS
jgi:nitroimidazol reductase NimA-like FMN-containing flavoprotein (pyridoxamine 5'-phosphate oxidase superfamily)